MPGDISWSSTLVYYAVVLYARPLVHYKSSDSKAYLRKIEPGSDAEVFLNRDLFEFGPKLKLEKQAYWFRHWT